MSRRYCHEAGCEGREGVQVPWIAAGEWEPGEPAFDTCPRCGGDLFNKPCEDDEEGEGEA